MPSRVHDLLETFVPAPGDSPPAAAPHARAGGRRPRGPADAALVAGERHLAAPDAGGPGTSTDPGVDLMKWKPDELSWHDYLVFLLTLGAEIEHALMVQYLYAAYSLGGEGVPEEHRERVLAWRDEVLTVAREEMGHLMTVQNLLRLLGGPMNLDRSDFTWDSRFIPYPFRLEPLTFESLSCYLYAEMPPAKEVPTTGRCYVEFNDEDRKAVEAVVKARTDNVLRATTVDKVYEAIIEIISSEEKIPDSAFDGGSYVLQASWDEWGKQYGPSEPVPQSTGPHHAGNSPRHERSPGVDDAGAARMRWDAHVIVPQMASRTQAIAALEDITGQGEAPHLGDAERRSNAPHRHDGDLEPSHFDRFLGIYQSWERCGARTATRDGWSPSRPVPINPTTVRAAKGARGGTYIESATSRAWAQLFNVRYRMLLTYLAHAYELPSIAGVDATARAGLIHRTFAEMYNLKAISGLLVRMPLRDDGGDDRAGPPFEMPYTVAMPQADVDRWRLHRELLESSIALGRELLKGAPPGEGRRYLESLGDLDARSVLWVEERIAGLGGARRTRA